MREELASLDSYEKALEELRRDEEANLSSGNGADYQTPRGVPPIWQAAARALEVGERLQQSPKDHILASSSIRLGISPPTLAP